MSLGQGRTVDLGVAHMRVLASGAATNGGAFALTEFSGTAEGAWTVPHLHRGFEESFFILDGLFTFTVGEEAIAASPGSTSSSREAPPHVQRSPGRRPVPAVDGARRAREDVLRARTAAAKRDPRPGCARRHLRPLRLHPGVARTPEATLARAGVLLPTPHPAVGTYMMAARTGSLLFVSVHGAFDSAAPCTPVGWASNSPTAEGTVAAEAVMLNLLPIVKAEVGELSANLLAGLAGQAAVSVCASMGGDEVAPPVTTNRLRTPKLRQ